MLCSSSAAAQQLYSPHGRLVLRPDQARVLGWLCSCSCHAWRSSRRASRAGNLTRTATGSSGGLWQAGGWGSLAELVLRCRRAPHTQWLGDTQAGRHVRNLCPDLCALPMGPWALLQRPRGG